MVLDQKDEDGASMDLNMSEERMVQFIEELHLGNSKNLDTLDLSVYSFSRGETLEATIGNVDFDYL